MSARLGRTNGSVSQYGLMLATSSSLLFVTYRLLQWRARLRAKATVDRIKSLVKEGEPLVRIKISE
jgi:hypothetical protein